MTKLRSLLKISIPAGVVYVTVSKQLWSVGVNSQEAEQRIVSQSQVINDTLAKTGNLVKPYLPESDVKLTNVKYMWNCGVKMVFRNIADFDVSKLIDRLTSNEVQKKS